MSISGIFGENGPVMDEAARRINRYAYLNARHRVDLSDLSHSYPLLHLARKFGVHYFVILGLAEGYDGGYMAPPNLVTGMTEVAVAVHAVCHAPWRWQFPPEGKGL